MSTNAFALAIASLTIISSGALAAGACQSNDGPKPAVVFKGGTNPDGYFTVVISGYQNPELRFQSGSVVEHRFDLGSCSLSIGDIQASVDSVSVPAGQAVEVAEIVNPDPGATGVKVRFKSRGTFKGRIQYRYTMYINTKQCDPNVATKACPKDNDQIADALGKAQRVCSGRVELSGPGVGCVVDGAEIAADFDSSKCWFAYPPARIDFTPHADAAPGDAVGVKSHIASTSGLKIIVAARGSRGGEVCAHSYVDYVATPRPWPPK